LSVSPIHARGDDSYPETSETILEHQALAEKHVGQGEEQLTNGNISD
jgi:hypothetical protein